MANDTVTIELQGAVTLARFRDAVDRFTDLVEGLAGELKASGLRWELDDLQVGSATATARGVPANGASHADLDRVVRSYLEVGQALASRTTVPFAVRVQKSARELSALIGDGVTAVRFETAEADALVSNASTTPAPPDAQPTAAYGAVTGRVQALTSRGGLRFTLYDTLSDRAVSCYLAEGSEDQAREIWDRLAQVEGWISRDPDSGRPLSVRGVTTVEVLEETDVRGYQRARGALPRGSAPRAEERIRRLRDAG